MSILIVEDCDDMRRSLRSVLESRGYPGVREAGNAIEALEILQTESGINLIVSDVNMPGLSGIDLCRAIKSDVGLHDIPVLMLTGLTDETTLQEAFEAGACDYIAKPVRVNELLARVRSAMNLKDELDRRREHERELVALTERLQQVNDKLEQLSVRDELTGIANRRYFNVLLNQEWGRALRTPMPLALLMIDIDFFKNYNDHYGHPCGDRCLASVADTLQALLRRPGDFVARYGGEEFVVLLADTEVPGALAVGERLRAGVEELSLDHAHSAAGPCVTISVGVAGMVPHRDNHPDRLLAAADQALYQAKATGRNRVVAFGGHDFSSEKAIGAATSS